MGDIEKFDLVTRKSMTLKHHAKGVTSLALFNANRSLVSSGRDGIITVWKCHEGKVLKTIVAEESLEALAVCDHETKACTTGENGGIRFWDLKTSSEVLLRRKKYSNVLDITLAGDVLVASKVEGDVLSLDPKDGTQRSLTVGNLDEVYDAKVLGRHIAIASNSNDVRILAPTESDIWDHSASLSGHTNVVLAIDVGGEFIASASKDKTARVWKFNEEESASSLVFIAEGHTEAVGAVALAKKQKNQPSREFFVTGAADRTVKLWSLGSNASVAKKVSAVWTVLAHEKDINCVEASPDNKIIASGSQDRTVKLWGRSDSTLIATCKGHRRGVWSVCFSPVDVVVVSASADKTIKAWNSTNGTCLRTIEGHGAAVLKVLFVSAGTQIASAGADGMVRIWNAREGSQSAEIDAHSDRVWSLSAISDGDRIVSGAANGTLRVWKDVSERVREERLEESYQRTLKDQVVSDSIRNQDWSAALRGAVELSQPRKVEHIVATVLKSDDGLEVLHQAIKELCTENESVKKLMEFCRDWNAVGGSVSMVAVTHGILRVIFTSIRMDRLAEIFKASSDKAILEALVAHSRRHYERVRGMSSAVSFLDFTLHRMLSLGEVKDGARKEKRPSKREVEGYRRNAGISEIQFSEMAQKRQFSALYEGVDELRREAKQQSRSRRRRSESVVS
uniref:U3 small nucleolar RNA-associated protein 13 C-terminal domain-containing protein n=1 Tax=Rhodosorus marinus TaxID=101924 RepID=A0A7S0BPX1_9RHOD